MSLKEETYEVIGLCMEVHNQLGAGFLEIVYKDALNMSFKKQTYFINENRNILLITRVLFCHINFMRILLFLTTSF